MSEKNKYYLLWVGTRGTVYPEFKPFVIGLSSKRPLSSKERTISWMRIGQGAFDDYRFAERIDRLKFKCVDTNQVFELEDDRGAFTQEAWCRFLNDESWKHS